jgi:purine nucleoside permease
VTVELDALVLPAFVDLPGLPGERAPWLDAYDLDATLSVPGVQEPLRYGDGLGVVPTGIGKCAAATTTAALCASDRVDLSDAPILSVGVAGGPPAEVTVGSVVVSETVLDWDDKVRWADGDGSGVMPNPYTGDAGVYDLDPDLVSRARALAEGVELADDDRAVEHRRKFEAPAARGDPTVVVGTNVCGDELWHGEGVAKEVERMVESHGAGPYRATEMEDVGTARALDCFGHLDRYLAVRGVSNFDRQPPETSVGAGFLDDDFEAGFSLGLENAVRVARAVVDDRVG